MQTAQRNDRPVVIEALARDPGRYSFFQAVELLLAWLADCYQVSRGEALDRLVRFENSRDLAFPAGDLAAVTLPSHEGEPPHAVLTTLFMGFTGTHGTLPHHYTARLAEDPDGGMQALLDVFSNRFIRHFHAAWRKSRRRCHRSMGKVRICCPC